MLFFVSRLTDDQLLFPAPDFIVEILSKGTASVDKGVKKTDYAAHGVREYWIIDPIRQRIGQYILFLPTNNNILPLKFLPLVKTSKAVLSKALRFQ